jgi:hypothetical protein
MSSSPDASIVLLNSVVDSVVLVEMAMGSRAMAAEIVELCGFFQNGH